MRSLRLLPLLALALLGAAMSAARQNAPGVASNSLANDSAAVASGQALYNQMCQSCHGPSGQGGDRGPALAKTALVHGNADAELFRAIKAGIPGTQMAAFAGLSDAEIWQIVAYLRSLQPASPALNSDGPEPGDGTRGAALFFGRAACAGCHEVNARGGIVGPDLSNAGRLSRAALRQKIVAPNGPDASATGRGTPGRGAPTSGTVVARTLDGAEIRGVRRNEDTFSLQMIDTFGELRLLDKLALASVVVDNTSLHPLDYATRFSTDEIDDIVTYLRMQKGRDSSKTAVAPPVPGGVTYERLRNARSEPHNWLMYWGDYQGTHYSSLDSINTTNVARLRPVWTAPVPGESISESAPIVVDGVMYGVSGGSPRTVTAIDARTGRQIWRFIRPQKIRNPGETDVVNRGVAILGRRLFVGTNDAALLCLDARTGLLLWEVQVADTMEGFNITSPPLVVKDKIIVGHAGGEYALRGFLDAYDLTGKRLWRFYTIPAPGESGHETWKGDSWKTGGGATWLTGTYDPQLNMLYWPVGNPAAMIDRSVRGEGDNLFTDSVVALDPDTGTLKWHYQFTPNDGHDWDSTEDMMLVDRVWRGRARKLLMHADRNGHFYVLDRTNGAFLSGTPFIHQTWNKGFDQRGRPMPIAGSNSSAEGSFLVYPTEGGATNFQSPSYSPLTGLFYLEYSEAGQRYVSAPQPPERGREYLGRAPSRGAVPVRSLSDPPPSAGIKALDPETGKTVWDFKLFQGSLSNGVLATAGGVLFASARDGNLIALDAKTGVHLWHYQTGGNHAASPISYAIGGRQYVALTAGNVLFSFALPQ
jgi:PQQ-dependent dehydrogenase (methanol/ethanol family)